MAPAGPPWRADDEIEAAQRLADALDHGGWLQPIAVADAPLDPGEEAYADMSVQGWRFHAIDVQYEHRTVMFGGPFLFAATGLASLVGNRRRHREAERIAAPQWRPLGLLRVAVTSQRLLVVHGGSWWSVWYSAVSAVRLAAEPNTVEVYFAADPPYRLSGTGVASVAVLVSRLSGTGTRTSPVFCS